MAPSQLKRLKSSLREQGLTGPSKSKKQKRNEQAKSADSRVKRHAALQGIRDSFNPFEVKAATRSVKSQTTNASNIAGRSIERAKSRPGVTKSMGEEVRRRTLLPEMQRKNKSGGLVDRRIGEDDASMNPEDRALQRFARERQRSKGAGLFDLEGDEEEGALTHGGKPLTLNGAPITDDYQDQSDDELAEDPDGEAAFLKRRFITMDEAVPVDSDGEAPQSEEPARKKSRTEVMKEVMAKSKLHKYERQKAKEDDDDLRDELDKGLPDLMALLAGGKSSKPEKKPDDNRANSTPDASMNPARLAMMNGLSRDDANKQYDARMRQMASDARAVPADKTKTAEEKAADEAKRLKELEISRQRRMQGINDDDDDDDDDDEDIKNAEDEEMVMDAGGIDDAQEFGFSSGIPALNEKALVLEDEDDFELDDEMTASDSDSNPDVDGSEDNSDDSDADNASEPAEADDDFVKSILGPQYTEPRTDDTMPEKPVSDKLAFVYDRPKTHDDFLKITKDLKPTEIPTVIQRIRAAHHTSLAAENKQKLAQFSRILIDHIAYMANHPADFSLSSSPKKLTSASPLATIEQIIRHIHSLSRTFPLEISTHFRAHLRNLHERGGTSAPTSGDLVILTAIGAIYPTSDHFHQVVTPAITLMGRWLGLTRPTTESDLRTGSALLELCLRYLRLSKRYMPECIRFISLALSPQQQEQKQQQRNDPAQLLPYVQHTLEFAELWSGNKSALIEIFSPTLLSALKHHSLPRSSTSASPSNDTNTFNGADIEIPSQTLESASKRALSRLTIQLQTSHLSRRTLELHHHRPLAIRSAWPRFEESFNPNSHYDPDRQRTESAKLAKEYKRERKGAIRDLRKDADFIARAQLKEKKERDAEYEKKYKRLVAEIQGEEGREAKVYEREKRLRKGGGGGRR